MAKYKFIILLFLAVLALFIFTIIQNFSFYWRDIFNSYYPLTNFIVESIKNNEFPLWNPYIFTGIPQFAALEPGVLYPATLIFLLFDYSTALIIILILHYFIAGTGMFFLNKHFGLSNYSSFIGGICFALSGYVISLYNVYPILYVICWIPYNLILLDKIIIKKDKQSIIYLILLNTLQLLSGRFDIIFISYLFFLSFIIFRLVHLPISPLIKGGVKSTGSIIFYLIIAFGLPLLLTAIQLIPSLELLQYSTREGGLKLSQGAVWSFPPLQLLELFIGGIMGDIFTGKGLFPLIGENFFGGTLFVLTVYPGIICTIFALSAVVNINKNKTYSGYIFYWIVIFLVFLLISSGKYLPVFPFLYQYIPGFNLIRYPVKIFIISIFALSVLTSYGCELFINREEQTKRIPVTTILITLFFTLTTLFGYILIPNFSTTLQSIINTTKQDIGIDFINQILHNIQNRAGLTLIILVVAILLFYFYSFFSFGEKWKKISLFVLGLLIFTDLFIVDVNQLWGINKDFYNKNSAIGTFLTDKIKNKSNFRILSTTKQPLPMSFMKDYMNTPLLGNMVYDKQVLSANTNMIYSLFNAYGYFPFQIKDIDLLYGGYLTTDDKELKRIIENILGARYIIYFPEQNQKISPKDKVIFDFPGLNVKILENPLSKRVSFQTDSIIVKDKNIMLDGIVYYKVSKFNPAENVIILNDENYKKSINEVKKEKSNKLRVTGPFIYQESNNNFSVYIYTNNSGYLVISDLFYPGWEVSLEGKNLPLLCANYLNKAVRIPAGFHQVNFAYKPFSFKIGMIISILGLIMLFILCTVKPRHLELLSLWSLSLVSERFP